MLFMKCVPNDARHAEFKRRLKLLINRSNWCCGTDRILSSTAISKSLIVLGLFSYTQSLKKPHRLKSRGFRSGDRDAHSAWQRLLITWSILEVVFNPFQCHIRIVRGSPILIKSLASSLHPSLAKFSPELSQKFNEPFAIHRFCSAVCIFEPERALLRQGNQWCTF